MNFLFALWLQCLLVIIIPPVLYIAAIFAFILILEIEAWLNVWTVDLCTYCARIRLIVISHQSINFHFLFLLFLIDKVAERVFPNFKNIMYFLIVDLIIFIQ